MIRTISLRCPRHLRTLVQATEYIISKMRRVGSETRIDLLRVWFPPKDRFCQMRRVVHATFEGERVCEFTATLKNLEEFPRTQVA